MKNTGKYFEELMRRYPSLKECGDDIMSAYEMLKKCYKNDGKILICGNGGSASDAEHLSGELMKGFFLKRELSKEWREKLGDEFAMNLQGALPAIPLTSMTALLTAFSNDVNPEFVYAQMVWGLGREGDILAGFSTSGNSKNILNAMKTAKAKGMKTLGFTGCKGGKLPEYCDVCIRVPSDITPEIQEYHLPVYHALSLMLEEEFFGE